ncbi:MAG: Rid family detoxifying hydrolase [Actinomycetota bacterium]|nr:Rid family detoxifying hydrolase [Actinomycetota bacterium]
MTALNAPAAIGPYAQAIRAAGLLFCSGQIPLDPQTDELVEGDTGDQARRCLENLSAVCAAAGTALSEAVRVTIYLTDIATFEQVNDVYGAFFEADPPARVAVAVSALPRGARVEIDAIVALTD